jgi:hypothetical protein
MMRREEKKAGADTPDSKGMEVVGTGVVYTEAGLGSRPREVTLRHFVDIFCAMHGYPEAQKLVTLDEVEDLLYAETLGTFQALNCPERLVVRWSE